MPGSFTNGRRAFIKTALGRYVKFATDNGFDTLFECLLIKVYRAEHVAMIGNGNCRHFVFFGFFKQLFQADHAIEKAVLGVDVEVDEISVLHYLTNPASN